VTAGDRPAASATGTPGERGPSSSGQGAVSWLMAQALVFGAMAALLGIVANAMFLDAYGSAWLPATYIAIGAAGIVVSGAVARSAQRIDPLAIALVVLGGGAAAIAASWVVARAGGAWVSVPLLVLFPILIQLGFVFIGGQAGRLLDIAGIKASFPRIMAGFPIGAVLGGVLGGQLVTWLGRTEDLLLATAVAQGAFAALVWITSRRHASGLGAAGSGIAPRGPAGTDDDHVPRVSLRRSLASRFVVLILAYQVMSAVGSQLSDFLVYDRAIAQYPDPADLARFLAGYTALMNVVSIAFLFLLAGPLLRRYGLRLGIAANPLVLAVLSMAMLGVGALSGGASFALLATVSAARIADIALTDGTTRTSINAAYQVLPERGRLAVQAAVEGMGVPVAIGISGVVILALNALPFALTATIVLTAIVCGLWTWIGILLHREYGPALVRALDRRPLLDPAAGFDVTHEDEAAAHRLLSSPDGRSTRLGLDLLLAMSSPALAAELGALATDTDPEVRMTALTALAAAGDATARRRLAHEVRASTPSPDGAIRLRAARALEILDPTDRAAAAALLEDKDIAVRAAALDAVQAGDTFALAPALAALGDAGSAGAAAGALGRLGDEIVGTLAERLDGAGSPVPVLVTRLVRAATTKSAARDEVLLRHVGHRDRELGLAILERLVGPDPVPAPSAAVLDALLDADLVHAARILAAVAALDSETAAPGASHGDQPLRRALADELDLVCLRVRAGRLARHGTRRLGPAMLELDASGPRGALAREALEVLLGPNESRVILGLLGPGSSVAERRTQLGSPPGDAPTALQGWLRDLVADPHDHWGSSWLRACAIHAAQARGTLEATDVAAARALRDPIVDELLAQT
jgi:hypothetical protein